MKRKENRKAIKIIGIILILGILIAGIISYNISEDARKFIDFNILQKETEEENTKYIKLDNETNPYIYAYDKYITILYNNTLQAYNSSAKKEFELNLTITNPIFESYKKYLVVAEKGGKKIYMINGKNIVWQTDVDGEIIRTNVNKNGYVSITTSQTTSKSVIITYSPEGKELFKTYLPNSYVIDTAMSNDNKYLAIAEINTDGTTTLQSGIQILSVEKIKNGDEDKVIYKNTSNSNRVISRIKYNDTNNLIQMHDSGIDLIHDGKEINLVKFNSDTLFGNIELDREVVETKQISEDGEVKTVTYILNEVNNKKVQYSIDLIPKEISANRKIIAINTGMKAYFVSNNGWLKKEYTSSQGIKEIVLGENIAGIVYKNKINIIKI